MLHHRLLEDIKTRGLNANVSVKLTQMGLELDPELTEEIAANLVAHAVETGNFVRIDMEGSALTQVTLDIVKRLHAGESASKPNRGHVGVVIQAYLYRSEKDICELMADGIRIRLCKGAYQEPPQIAFASKADVDQNFIRLMRMLVRSGIYHGISSLPLRRHDRGDPPVRERAPEIDPSEFDSRCFTESAAICSARSSSRATGCASTSPSAANGTPTSCAASLNGRPMCCFWRKKLFQELKVGSVQLWDGALFKLLVLWAGICFSFRNQDHKIEI